MKKKAKKAFLNTNNNKKTDTLQCWKHIKIKPKIRIKS